MFSLLLLLPLSFAIPAHSQANSDCEAFSSNGLAASNYQYYRFYDFRSISGTKHQRRQEPLGARSDTRNKTVSDGSWTDDWYIRNYPRKSPGSPSIPVDFILDRVYITQSTDESAHYSSFLTLSTARIDDETQEAGEITFKEFNASYASIRVFGRARGASGAVAGIFTYLNDTQESDIEMFTRNPAGHIQYSNQPASSGEPDYIPIPGATVNNTMPNNWKYGDWHVHRLDWTPGRSVLFVNDVQTNTTTLHVPVADPPSGIYIDMWSANSTWTLSMEIGNSAEFDIQWVELLFNTTNPPASQGSDQKVCPVGFFDQESEKQSWGLQLATWEASAIVLTVLFCFWNTMFVLGQYLER